MGLGALAGIGGAILGGAISSSGTSSAAKKAAEASKYGADIQYKMWQEAQQNFAPFLNAGMYGVDQLQGLISSPWMASGGQAAPGNYAPPSYAPPNTRTAHSSTPGGVASGAISNALYNQPGQGGLLSNLSSDGSMRQGDNFGPPRMEDYSDFYNPENNEWELQPHQRAEYDQAVKNYQSGAQGGGAAQSAQNYQPPGSMGSRLSGFNQPKLDMGAAAQGIQGFNLSNLPDASFTVNPITGELQHGQNASFSEGQLSQGGVLSPDLPDLPGEVDFKFDDSDPVYQHKLEQMNEQVNRQLASRGLHDSRAGLDVLADSNMRLIGDEADKQYGRIRGERDYMAQRATDIYQMGAQRGQTLYDRLYGQQGDLYNRMYGQAMGNDARRMSLLQDQYNIAANQYGLDYQGALDLTKIGANAAGSAGQGAISSGQGIASSLAQAGNAQAQGQLANSNMWANAAAGLGTVLGNQFNTGGSFGNYINDPGNYYSPGTIL